MNEDPILRPEFELYMKMSSEREERTTKAIEKMAEENTKQNESMEKIINLLTKYINKHDRLEERVNTNSDDIRDLSEAVVENSKTTNLKNIIKKGFAILISGILLAAGGIYANTWWGGG